MTAVTLSLDAPDELREALGPLLPALAGKGVERLVVFSYRRPGEPEFWQVFLFVGDKRHSVGTPNLRTQPLADQVPDLLRQLEAFQPPSDEAADASAE